MIRFILIIYLVGQPAHATPDKFETRDACEGAGRGSVRGHVGMTYTCQQVTVAK